jgi:hypothetical protein
MYRGTKWKKRKDRKRKVERKYIYTREKIEEKSTNVGGKKLNLRMGSSVLDQ